MIKKLQHTKKKKKYTLILDRFKNVEKIDYKLPGNNSIYFKDGSDSEGICVGCYSKPCLNYIKEEIDINILNGMPYNSDTRVCPTDAIREIDSGQIEIDSNLCVNCGICFSKCPTAGIFYNQKSQSFDVNKNFDDSFKILKSNKDHLINHTENEFKNSIKTFTIKKISKDFSKKFLSKLKSFSSNNSDLELILVRNILLEVGVKVKVTAKGNNDLRLDFIGSYSDKFLPGESGLIGSDILALPRRILEGISWINSRKKIVVQDQIPCLVILEFPSKRSDFYEVITDIENVTGIKIKTLSIYFLIIINLFKIKLSGNDLKNSFTINKTNKDYSVYFKMFIKNIEKIDENYGNELYTFRK